MQENSGRLRTFIIGGEDEFKFETSKMDLPFEHIGYTAIHVGFIGSWK